MCKHCFGCRLIQKLIETGNEETLRSIVMCLIDSFELFVKDPYGNYVIQYIMEKSGKYMKERYEIIKRIIAKLDEYCLEKYASNVVEKCLKNASMTDLECIIKSMSTTA